MHLDAPGDQIADLDTFGIGRPLSLADFARLRPVVDKEPAARQQTFRKFAFALGIGADAVEVSTGLHGLRVEERSRARCCCDYHIAIGDCGVAIGRVRDFAASGEMRFKRNVALTVYGDIADAGEPGQHTSSPALAPVHRCQIRTGESCRHVQKAANPDRLQHPCA